MNSIFSKQFLLKVKFNSGLIGLFINPFFWPRRKLFNEFKSLSSHISGKILDVGCGKKPYKDLFKYDSYIGLDIHNEGHDHTEEDIDIYYDGKTFPCDNGEYDSLLVNQVLEHVFNPVEFLHECNRVLKNDGKLLLSVPFAWNEHEQPLDYGRYSSFGIISLLESSGFEIIYHKKTLNDFRAITSMIMLYFQESTRTGKRFWDLFTSLIYIGPLNILGYFLFKLLPRVDSIFIDNVVLCRKI